MLELYNYLDKNVTVIDVDDTVYKNYYVQDVTSAADNDDENEESIGILPSKNATVGVELFASEIKSIDLVD